jgi:hypothetical protein
MCARLPLAASGACPDGLTDWDDDKTVVVFEVQTEPMSTVMPLPA